MEWFKFYHNKWLVDPAICSLQVQDRLCFITLLCLASQADDRDGSVKYIDEDTLIRLTRLDDNPLDTENCDVTKARGCVTRFVTVGLVEVINDQILKIINFEKRQSQAMTGAERVRLHRARKQNVTKCNDESYNVTLDKIREDKNSIGDDDISFQEIDDDGDEVKKYAGVKKKHKIPKIPFRYDNEIKKLFNSSVFENNVVADYLTFKERKFENWEQWAGMIYREIKSAKGLKGYNSKQIRNAFEYCKEQWDENWTLETVAKWIANANK